MIASFFATYIYMGLISLNMRPLWGRFLQLCPLRQKFPDNKCVNGLSRELGNLSVL